MIDGGPGEFFSYIYYIINISHFLSYIKLIQCSQEIKPTPSAKTNPNLTKARCSKNITYTKKILICHFAVSITKTTESIILKIESCIQIK